MKYIYNQKNEEIKLNKEQLARLIKKDSIDDGLYKEICENIEEILCKYEGALFRKNHPEYFDIKKEDYEKLLAQPTEIIRNEILSKYLLSENLHFLMSNGCSMYAGSKAINVLEETEDKKLLKSFKFSGKVKNKDLEIVINSLEKERPEKALDRLYEIKSYCENILTCDISCKELIEFIDRYKKIFIENYVFTIDYSTNSYHKAILKRITSRNSKLNKVNIFTLNYDVLIEKTAEEMGIIINNGFIGFHNRVFNPASFHLDVHFNNADGAKYFSKSINLFKLHGSLSWKLDETKPPYGITEIQIEKVNDEKIIPDCIIYPVQTKKKHSLDLPYSEMFRQFIELVNKPSSTLIIVGYSFLDEHVNDIITNALSNPSFNLIIFSFLGEAEAKDYLKLLFERSKYDSRITIFSGKILGNFEYIAKFLIPYIQDNSFEEKLRETFKMLMRKE